MEQSCYISVINLCMLDQTIVEKECSLMCLQCTSLSTCHWPLQNSRTDSQVLHAYHDNYDFIMEMQIIVIDYDEQNFANYIFSYSHCRNPGSAPDAST